MNRIVLAVALAVAYFSWRFPGAVRPTPAPTPVIPSAVTPFPDITAVARGMTASERRDMSEAYAVLSRAVAANPAAEPVFEDTGSVRRAHRAALLLVWKGVLNNEAGKYPGLREGLEGALAKRIGTDEVPLNPALQQQTAQAFADIAASFQ